MSAQLIYYVYAYLRKDGTPYYIGKGKGYRYGGPHSVEVPPRKRIKFVKENISEDEAYELEKELIEKYGRINFEENGILENKSIGGGGHSSGITWTKERKEKFQNTLYSNENRKTRQGQTNSPEHRAKISKAHIGKKLSAEHIEKIKKSRAKQIMEPHNEETKIKISEALIGKTVSNETKSKMSSSAKNRKKTLCPKCQNEFNFQNIKRHMNRCKK